MRRKKELPPLTNEEGDVREWQTEDFAEALTFNELPVSLQEKLTAIQKRGRPYAEMPKKTMTFRFAPDIREHIKALGRGYNTRVENVLREALEQKRI